MVDNPKENEKTSEAPSKDNKEIKHNTKETVDSKEIIEKPPKELVEKTSIPEEQTDEKPKKKESPKDAKTQKNKEQTKEKKGKKDDKAHKDDFSYIVRIANTDVDGEKNLIYGLASIRGIGMQMSHFVVDNAGIDRNIKMGYLTDAQIEKLKQTLEEITEKAPRWMLNHRKDYETGEDIHIVGTDIDVRLRDEINIMKKIRSYRGIRHELGLPVRGQRTRANNRKGLALGVSKKKV